MANNEVHVFRFPNDEGIVPLSILLSRRLDYYRIQIRYTAKISKTLWNYPCQHICAQPANLASFYNVVHFVKFPKDDGMLPDKRLLSSRLIQLLFTKQWHW